MKIETPEKRTQRPTKAYYSIPRPVIDWCVGDKCRIIGGFYDGRTGVIVGERFDKRKNRSYYYVHVGDNQTVAVTAACMREAK